MGSITNKEMSAVQARMMHPLTLAYIGDTVYDLFVRTYLIYTNDVPVHQLHKMSVSFVKAQSQSEALHKIEELLTEEEMHIVRRGRNAKSGTIPKNAAVTEYRWATGFESLLGYLYLTGQGNRLCEIAGNILLNEAKKE
ncbi:MAG TPA: Mini-ribonuclease 3 [Clostridiales bacterium]|nr:ribonuclease III domain-containing protein [Clostridia bacterium]MDD4680520.1 ribonuclease III domain-containing protein [Clostridia bacterium]HCS75517.1 Mini-ribonuclease 3 [Clostridiales bacterium]